MHRDLRVIGAGLDDEVAVAAHRLEVVAREVGERDERLGEAVRDAEAVAVGVRRAR